jgi:hypothetical protein
MASERRAKVFTEVEFRRVLAVARGNESGTRNVALLYASFALGLSTLQYLQVLVT